MASYAAHAPDPLDGLESSGERLDNVVEGLLGSYRQHGGINHLEGPNLPSMASIEALTETLRSLLFPGFFEAERVNRVNLRFAVGRRAAHVLEELTCEVCKSLMYEARLRQAEDGTPLYPHGVYHRRAHQHVMALLETLPELRQVLQRDAEAALRGDPAARSLAEVILSYPGMRALSVHRLANFLHKLNVPLIPRMMAELIHGRTGIDVHPGATIAPAVFIDHGTGVVIGETAVIGEGVKIYQGVTLGALSVSRKELPQARAAKRHPTIEDNVTIYAGATILGGDTVIGAGSVIGGNVWLTHSVPPGTRVLFEPQRLRYENRQGRRVRRENLRDTEQIATETALSQKDAPTERRVTPTEKPSSPDR